MTCPSPTYTPLSPDMRDLESNLRSKESSVSMKRECEHLEPECVDMARDAQDNAPEHEADAMTDDELMNQIVTHHYYAGYYTHMLKVNAVLSLLQLLFCSLHSGSACLKKHINHSLILISLLYYNHCLKIVLYIYCLRNSACDS